MVPKTFLTHPTLFQFNLPNGKMNPNLIERKSTTWSVLANLARRKLP